MAKEKSVFYCQNCGYESAKWMGQCPACHEWNTFAEEKIAPSRGNTRTARKPGAENRPTKLSEISMEHEARTKTEIGELDRVLGGGIVRGSLILIGGDPGIGKSTLLLQACRNLAAGGKNVLYVSGEESLQQIKMRADRIGEISDSMRLLCETNMEDIDEILKKEQPDIAVIDSIQTMSSDAVDSAPGSVSQVREATAVLLMTAKTFGISIFIVGHVTKEGAVAGPRVLEHMVDTVLYFEGDRHASYRILRAAKNRFGSTDEIGVFEMRNDGLSEVPNPSEYMLSGKPENSSGSVVSCCVEGSRPVLVEIQALVCKTSFGMPRRTAAGADYNRVNLLMAVLEKRMGMDLSSCDAYINIAGGIRMNEPAVDLGILMAIVSSYQDLPIDDSLAAFGEVGLSGEVRAVRDAVQRIQELKKLGFRSVVLPKANMRSLKAPEDIELLPVSTIQEAVRAVRRSSQKPSGK